METTEAYRALQYSHELNQSHNLPCQLISPLCNLQAYAGSQVLQSIILLCTGTNTGGGYLAPRWLFLVMYIGLTLIWAVLNTFALEVIAFLDVISMWWQVT